VLTAFGLILLWGLALSGLGSLPGIREFLPGLSAAERLPLRIVSGLALLAAAATLWNLFAGIGPSFAGAALIAGLFGAWRARGELRESAAVTGVPAILVSAFLLSGVCGYGVTLYDSGLYHLQAIRWATEGAIPFGLANLHERFGVASLWFSVPPGISLPGFPGSGSVLAPALLALALSLTVWNAIRRVVHRVAGFSDTILAAGFVPIAWAFVDRSLPSPSPDLAVAFLTILALAHLARAFEGPADLLALRRAAFLGLFAAAVKLSAAPLAATLLAIAAFGAFRPAARPRLARELGMLLAPLILLGIPWAARGVVATGHLLYPLPATRVAAASWAVPLPLVELDRMRIESWARHPGIPLTRSIPFRQWAPSWARRHVRLFAFPPTPVGVHGALLLLSALVLAVRGIRLEDRLPLFVPVAVAAAGLVFWFLTAPDPRFALGLLYGVSVPPLVAVLRGAGISAWSNRSRAALAAAAIALTVLAIAAGETFRSEKRPSAWPGLVTPLPPPPIGVRARKTASGDSVLTPSAGDRCWDARLPCTPYFRPSLVIGRDASGRIRSFSLPADEPAIP
jgi:hypothetical protein